MSLYEYNPSHTANPAFLVCSALLCFVFQIFPNLTLSFNHTRSVVEKIGCGFRSPPGVFSEDTTVVLATRKVLREI